MRHQGRRQSRHHGAWAIIYAALGKATEGGEPRATHRRPKRRYKKRVRMPSKLDPHQATIESWLAAEPQLTALAIVGRQAERDPETFGPKQHSIVQRLLKALRTKATERPLASTAPSTTTTDNDMPGPVDGSAYDGPDPSTSPLSTKHLHGRTMLRRLPFGNIRW